MKMPTLNVSKNMIQGYYPSRGFGVIINVPVNTELKTGMTLTIGELSFIVTDIQGINPNKNTYVFTLSGAEVLDLILKHA